MHGVSVALAATEQPDESPVAPTSLVVAASDPPLPPGRRILVRGTDSGAGAATVVATDVVTCTSPA